jgi:hypothetical protein
MERHWRSSQLTTIYMYYSLKEKKYGRKANSHLTPSKKPYNQYTQNIKFTFAEEPSHHYSSFESLDSIFPK